MKVIVSELINKVVLALDSISDHRVQEHIDNIAKIAQKKHRRYYLFGPMVTYTTKQATAIYERACYFDGTESLSERKLVDDRYQYYEDVLLNVLRIAKFASEYHNGKIVTINLTDEEIEILQKFK